MLSKATSITLPGDAVVAERLSARADRRRAGWLARDARRVLLEILPVGVISLAAIPLTIVALAPPNQLALGAKIAVSAYSLAFYLVEDGVAHGSLAAVRDAATRRSRGAAFHRQLRRRRSRSRRRLARMATVAGRDDRHCSRSSRDLSAARHRAERPADRRRSLHVSRGAGARDSRRRRWLRSARHAARGARSSCRGVTARRLGVLTWRQSAIWHDPRRFGRTFSHDDPQSSIAETALGRCSSTTSAIPKRSSISSMRRHSIPSYAEGHDNLGIALSNVGRLDEGMAQFRTAIALSPRNHESHNNLGIALARQGKIPEAIAEYRAALAIKPDYADAQTNWGNARCDSATRRGDGALSEAARLRPDLRGRAAQLGRRARAAGAIRRGDRSFSRGARDRSEQCRRASVSRTRDAAAVGSTSGAGPTVVSGRRASRVPAGWAAV